MLDVKILDTCTLLQACEWIAFKWEPMDDVYEQYVGRIRPIHPFVAGITIGVDSKPSIDWDTYANEITKATAALMIVFPQNKIKVTGVPVSKNSEIPNPTHNQQEQTIINFENHISLDIKNNYIAQGNTLIHSDIRIDFKDLSSIFPSQPRKKQNPYRSPYMLLMEKVIDQEGITRKNQSKHSVLKNILEQKMKDMNLPKSEKLASAMATLIRAPESQKGRKPKK